MKAEVLRPICRAVKTGSLVSGLLALSMTASSARAASGDVSVDISFPPLIILYYYDDIDIAVNADDFAQVLENGATGCISANGALSCAAGSTLNFPDTGNADSISGTTLTYAGDINTEAGAATVDTNLSFVLENVWAVRALVPAGATLDASVTGVGDFTNLAITPTQPAASMTLSNAAATDNIGDLSFDVDVSNGLVASDTLTVTVVASL